MALLQNTPATTKTRYKTSWLGAPPPFVLRQALGYARTATFHLFWQVTIHLLYRSEERRVGKEWRSRRSRDHSKETVSVSRASATRVATRRHRENNTLPVAMRLD